MIRPERMQEITNLIERESEKIRMMENHVITPLNVLFKHYFKTIDEDADLSPQELKMLRVTCEQKYKDLTPEVKEDKAINDPEDLLVKALNMISMKKEVLQNCL